MKPLQEVLHRAQARGLLPPEATLPAQDERPWPVLLLIALGAWLAALPLVGVIGLLFGGFLGETFGPWLAGVLLIAGAVVTLRSQGLPIFVEQLALPALLAGGASLGFGLYRDTHESVAAGALGLLALGIAWAVPRGWLRALLGALAAVFAVLTLVPPGSWEGVVPDSWFALHLVLVIGLGILAWQERWLTGAEDAPRALLLQPLVAGWLLAALAGLAWWSGVTFLVGGVLGGFGELAQTVAGARQSGGGAFRVVSALLAAGAATLLARAWPALRQPPAAGVALVAIGLAWFLPALGAVLLALVCFATRRRWAMAGAAGAAAAWIIGACYYQLQWTLADKALVLAVAGAVLGALAWWALRPRLTAGAGSHAARGSAGPAWTLAASAVLILAVANGAIWQKERLIAHGDRLFVRLAPVDPRSLVQGDFMRLAWPLPPGLERWSPARAGERPVVVARVDARGVAQRLRLAQPGEAPGRGEYRIALTPKDGRWTLVSDAWFFAEGEAGRWERARHGEFRVDAQGHALLVGLADEHLQAITPSSP